MIARSKGMFFAYLYPKTLDLIFLHFTSSTLHKFILKLKNAKIITLKRKRKKKKESLLLLKLTFLKRKTIVCLA